MQIREQGRQVQLIRSPYDPTKKRCVQKVVHTFQQRYSYAPDNLNIYLSDEQFKDLSDDEKKTLSDWMKKKADKRTTDDRLYAIRLADSYIIKSADAISAVGVDTEKAGTIWAAIEKLSKVLKKAGHPKSKGSK